MVPVPDGEAERSTQLITPRPKFDFDSRELSSISSNA